MGKNKPLPPWLNAGNEKWYARFPRSMARHPAYLSLSPAARCLYTQYCLFAPYEKGRPDMVGEGGFKFRGGQWEGRAFYMTWKAVERLHVGCEATFRKAVGELLKGGFIEILFRGERGKKNTYALSSKWWKP